MGLSEVLARLETAFMALNEIRGQLDGTTSDDTAWELGVALARIRVAKRLVERDIKIREVEAQHGDPDSV